VPSEDRDDFLCRHLALTENEAVRQEKDAPAALGMLIGHDDLGTVSIHGTITQANEKNETSVYNGVFTNIGRTPGNAVPVIAQKNLTRFLNTEVRSQALDVE
jgi:fatty acid synthase subunit alpha, fungi type